jgi:hypothetical protein
MFFILANLTVAFQNIVIGEGRIKKCRDAASAL